MSIPTSDLAAAGDALITGFVEAFNRGDVARCSAFFTDDASLHFMAKIYRGRPVLEHWFGQRFASGAQIVAVTTTEATTGGLIIQANVTSRKLQAWRLGIITGRAVFKLDDEQRIVECRLGLAGLNRG